jgi:hypothetical protein
MKAYFSATFVFYQAEELLTLARISDGRNIVT